METAEFFKIILPEAGLRCVATSAQSGFAHRFFDGNSEAASATLASDANGKTTYFGCATYLTDHNRTGANVAKVRAFWLDIDCGPDKPYLTQTSALLALAGFKKKLSLPTPWIVSSGVGLHVYWVMDADMNPDEWRESALALKAATVDLKLKVDQSRTGDISTVLRAVGTHHRKQEDRPVWLIKEGALSSKF